MPSCRYRNRLGIWFQTTKRGQRTAYYWSFPAMRAIRMGVNEADLFIATDKADLLAGHPMKG